MLKYCASAFNLKLAHCSGMVLPERSVGAQVVIKLPAWQRLTFCESEREKQLPHGCRWLRRYIAHTPAANLLTSELKLWMIAAVRGNYITVPSKMVNMLTFFLTQVFVISRLYNAGILRVRFYLYSQYLQAKCDIS